MPSIITDLFGLSPRGGLSKTDKAIVGVECEIESLRDIPHIITDYWQIKDDNSLRNVGKEFVTEPVSVEEAIKHFTLLHNRLIYKNSAEAFSERTSIHVHLNCHPLTEEQVKNLVFLYAMFEDFFFAQTIPERKNNIHCVPLHETYLPSVYGNRLVDMRDSWSKYSALNLLPLREFGTVEFRHMHGHGEVDTFTTWLRSISNLFYTCQKVTIDPVTISNPDQIKDWFSMVFEGTYLAKARLSIPETISDSVIDVKLAF